MYQQWATFTCLYLYINYVLTAPLQPVNRSSCQPSLTIATNELLRQQKAAPSAAKCDKCGKEDDETQRCARAGLVDLTFPAVWTGWKKFLVTGQLAGLVFAVTAKHKVKTAKSTSRLEWLPRWGMEDFRFVVTAPRQKCPWGETILLSSHILLITKLMHFTRRQLAPKTAVAAIVSPSSQAICRFVFSIFHLHA